MNEIPTSSAGSIAEGALPGSDLPPVDEDAASPAAKIYLVGAGVAIVFGFLAALGAGILGSAPSPLRGIPVYANGRLVGHIADVEMAQNGTATRVEVVNGIGSRATWVDAAALRYDRRLNRIDTAPDALLRRE